jgi:hypothetical protein
VPNADYSRFICHLHPIVRTHLAFIGSLWYPSVKEDKVGPHTDLLTNFPYVGSPHKAWSKELVAA